MLFLWQLQIPAAVAAATNKAKPSIQAGWRGGAAQPLSPPSPLPSPRHCPPPLPHPPKTPPGARDMAPPGGPHERHSRRLVQPVGPGSQPPAPGRAGFTTFKAEQQPLFAAASHCAADGQSVVFFRWILCETYCAVQRKDGPRQPQIASRRPPGRSRGLCTPSKNRSWYYGIWRARDDQERCESRK